MFILTSVFDLDLHPKAYVGSIIQVYQFLAVNGNLVHSHIEILTCRWWYSLCKNEVGWGWRVYRWVCIGCQCLLIMVPRYRGKIVSTKTALLKASDDWKWVQGDMLMLHLVLYSVVEHMDQTQSSLDCQKWARVDYIAGLGTLLKIFWRSQMMNIVFVAMTLLFKLSHTEDHVDNTSQRLDTILGFWKDHFCHGEESIQKYSWKILPVMLRRTKIQ